MDALHDDLYARSTAGLLPWVVQCALAERYGLTLADVESQALALGLLPARYQRNRQTISVAQQLRLCRSRVAVIGCGGLGGYLLEELARLGVGTLVAVDPDIFEEHNLNRQLLATPANLGHSKVAAAVARIGAVNPAVTVIPHQCAFGPENGRELLGGAQVVLDALDSIPARLALDAACAELGLPLVHGAIGGWYGQVATLLPGDPTLSHLYRRPGESRGVEQQLGNPAFTPAVIASLQVAETCKLLLDLPSPLRHAVLTIDLQAMDFEIIPLGQGAERNN